MATLKIRYLKEPNLQFGGYFEHPDSKTGLREFGPFGKSITGLHPTSIRIGFVGTKETIYWAQNWINRCSGYIESENIKKRNTKTNKDALLFDLNKYNNARVIDRLEKILTPDFVGFNKTTSFASEFQVNDRWIRIIRSQDIASILTLAHKADIIWKLVNLFDDAIASISQTDPTPDIIIVSLPPEVESDAHSVRLSGNYYLNLRRAIKARSMRWNIPLQLLTESTVTGDGRDVQDVATRAWNFCTAQYYKANGIPWRISTLEENTCFVGVSFFVDKDVSENLTMRSSIAQAFDYEGQGLILRGDSFDWDEFENGRSPHLTKELARKLMSDTLKEYIKLRGTPPKRVVIHKTSEFWGAEHKTYNEIEGFQEGVADVYKYCEIDLVALSQSSIKLFREGMYPPLRGTYFNISDSHFLYTMGYIPFLETYPKSYVPLSWEIKQHIGDTPKENLFKEILALTKMNVNNCSFADSWPITLSFSKMVGEIMKHIPEGGKIQSKYRFYM